MTRAQFAMLIAYAEWGLEARGGPRAMEHQIGHEAISAAKEEFVKWPTEDEIDETPRLPA